MSKYSETMGSFIRNGNYSLEANYKFDSEEELKQFYSDSNNADTLHEGLLRVVTKDSAGKQALFWVVNNSGNLELQKLFQADTVEELLKKVNELSKKLDGTTLEHSDLSEAINKLQDQITARDEDFGYFINIILHIVGEEQLDYHEIHNYITNSLEFGTLTKINDALYEFFHAVKEEGKEITTLPELQRFLSGYSNIDTLKDVIVDVVSSIYKDIESNSAYVQGLESKLTHSDQNLQSELDRTQIGVGLSGDGSYNSDKETYYLQNATSVMNALKILDSLINQAINNCNLETKDSDTIELSINKEPNKTTISADVKISQESGNDIQKRLNGIYSHIDSEYQNGVLTIYVNGNVRQQHILGLSSIVDNAYYDPNLESIVIIFKLQDGGTETVTIPTASLISEWEVDNVHNTVVELTKERVVFGGADKLYADVRISDSKENILEKEGNTLIARGTTDKLLHNNRQLDSVINLMQEANVLSSGQIANLQSRVDDLYSMAGIETISETELNDILV